ncbi:MAG: universal stress protein [Gemmatimonadaceae bacterium]
MASAIQQDIGTRDTAEQLASEPLFSQKAAGPLIVATDGTVRSDAALRAARAIASRTNQKVYLLGVIAPLPVMGPEVELAVSPTMEADRRKGFLLQVLEQSERVGITEPWPVKVTSGYPAATIARLARNVDASLIIMGLGGHGVIDRIFGDEMVLQVLRVGTVPVLAVADGFTDLPKRALAAVDFSASSKRAFELGAPLVSGVPGSRLTVAHVISAETDPLNWRAVDPPRVGSVGRVLDNFAAAPAVARGVAMDRRVLAGDPANALLALSRELDADLIITGSHGHNFLSRLLLGSVSTTLLRKAGCSILVAPPVAEPDLDEELPEVRGRFAFFDWTERLEEFTRRNISRAARLEVFDPEIGAQVIERSVSFVGASFDPRDARVHLMFSSGPDVTQHHTHCIEGVTAIQILRNRAGAEMHLRIGHGRAQTLLTLER